MPLFETKTLCISIDAPFGAVVADLAEPMNHLAWATEFFEGDATPAGKNEIFATVPMMGGAVKMKIDAHTAHGIVDLYLAPQGGDYGPPLPVRIIANNDGADVLWTLSRFPGVPDAAWSEGLASMERELVGLKERLENL